MTRAGLPLPASASLVRAATTATIPMPGNQMQQADIGSRAVEEGDDGGGGGWRRQQARALLRLRGICPCMQSSNPEPARTLGAGAGQPREREQGQSWRGSRPG